MNINNIMANKLQKFLGDVARGYLYPKGNMGDFQHAARLYVDDTFRLAPKTKFLYYVIFNINPDALEDISFEDRHMLELNYLVKSADLPKYSFKTETLNQYNRKTNVYTSIQYEPVSISLHDDNNGITNTLWALYYGYYIKDRLNNSDPESDVSPVAYKRNTYNSKQKIPFRYGLDNDSDEPFFNSIQIVTLSRQRFFSYLLCNPKITKWDHDTVNQSEGNGILENKMTIAYDAVIYNSGMVHEDYPGGFAVLHYDKTPSPIVGEEVLQKGIQGIFGDVFSLNRFGGGAGGLVGGLLGGLVGGLVGGISSYTNTGNRMPYGYGQPTYFNPFTPLSSRSTSGFQQYGFGSQLGITGALTVAGVGLAANALGNVIEGVGRGVSSIFNSPDSSKTVQAPNGADPSAEDAFGPPEPKRRPENLDDAGAGRGSVVEKPGERAAYEEANNPQEPQEPGYTGAGGEILNDALNGSKQTSVSDFNQLDYVEPSKGETPTSVSDYNQLDYVDPQQIDLSRQMIENNPGGTGNSEFDVGSPFG